MKQPEANSRDTRTEDQQEANERNQAPVRFMCSDMVAFNYDKAFEEMKESLKYLAEN